MKWWDQIPLSSSFECLVLSQLFPLSPFSFIKTLFSSSSLSALNVVSSAYLRLLIFLLALLIPACASSSPAFHMMCVLPFIKIKFHLFVPFVFGASSFVMFLSCVGSPAICRGPVAVGSVTPPSALAEWGSMGCCPHGPCLGLPPAPENLPVPSTSSPAPALHSSPSCSQRAFTLGDPPPAPRPLVPSTSASRPPLYLFVSTVSQLPFACRSAALHRLGPLLEDRSSALWVSQPWHVVPSPALLSLSLPHSSLVTEGADCYYWTALFLEGIMKHQLFHLSEITLRPLLQNFGHWQRCVSHAPSLSILQWHTHKITRLWRPPLSSLPLSLGLPRLPAPVSDSGHEYSGGRVLVQQAVTQKPLAGGGGGVAFSLGARCGWWHIQCLAEPEASEWALRVWPPTHTLLWPGPRNVQIRLRGSDLCISLWRCHWRRPISRHPQSEPGGRGQPQRATALLPQVMRLTARPPWSPVTSVVSDESRYAQVPPRWDLFPQEGKAHPSWLIVKTAYNWGRFRHLVSFLSRDPRNSRTWKGLA